MTRTIQINMKTIFNIMLIYIFASSVSAKCVKEDIDYYLEEKKVENLREVELKTKIKVDKPLSNKLSYENQKKLKSLNMV